MKTATLIARMMLFTIVDVNCIILLQVVEGLENNLEAERRETNLKNELTRERGQVRDCSLLNPTFWPVCSAK